MDFIHLSDLHLTASDAFQAALTRALNEDLKKAIDKGIAPQFIIFSGDIANVPDESDIYSILVDRILHPILDICGLGANQVAFVPGNHDVSRNIMQKHRLLYDSIQQIKGDQDKLMESVRNADFQEYCWNISKPFFEMCKQLGQPWHYPLYNIYTHASSSISIVSYNGAFACSLKGSLADRGQLAYPIELALAGIQQAQQSSFVGTIIHHPLTEFISSVQFEALVNAHSKLHLYGHVHNARPLFATAPLLLVDDRPLAVLLDRPLNDSDEIRVSEEPLLLL